MMTVQIWGLPCLPQKTLRKAIEKMYETLRPVTRERIFIYCPADMLDYELGGVILIKVEGWPGDPYDGPEPRKGYSERIFKDVAQQVKDLIPGCEFVQCHIAPPRENQTYDLVTIGDDKD